MYNGNGNEARIVDGLRARITIYVTQTGIVTLTEGRILINSARWVVLYAVGAVCSSQDNTLSAGRFFGLKFWIG